MKKFPIVATMLAVLGSAILLSSSIATPALAQDEEYMQEHDGGDRDEYLQEMEHSDPWFYVPPTNDASLSTINNNSTTD